MVCVFSLSYREMRYFSLKCTNTSNLVRCNNTIININIINIGITAINSPLRQYFSVYTSVTSALDVSFETECAI